MALVTSDPGLKTAARKFRALFGKGDSKNNGVHQQLRTTAFAPLHSIQNSSSSPAACLHAEGPCLLLGVTWWITPFSSCSVNGSPPTSLFSILQGRPGSQCSLNFIISLLWWLCRLLLISWFFFQAPEESDLLLSIRSSHFCMAVTCGLIPDAPPQGQGWDQPAQRGTDPAAWGGGWAAACSAGLLAQRWPAPW